MKISQGDEVNKAIDVDSSSLLGNKVFVIWKWKSYESNPSTPDGGVESDLDNEGNGSSDNEDTSKENDADDDAEQQFSLPSITHVVTFKCIGASRGARSQEVLFGISENEAGPQHRSLSETRTYEPS